MPKFFTEHISADEALITGPDAAHILRVLRMRKGDRLTVCDMKGTDFDCEIKDAQPGLVTLRVLAFYPSPAEPDMRVTLFQCLPKADKMEWIVQKSVELGVFAIVPVLSARCVSRPDDAALSRKVERWNRIAKEAAKQCGRSILPKVERAMALDAALGRMSLMKQSVMFYENCRTPLSSFSLHAGDEIGVLIGPEGGFEPYEAQNAGGLSIPLCGLGPRILRTETAPLCALSAIMFATGNL